MSKPAVDGKFVVRPLAPGPGLRYTVPYMHGPIGICYQRTLKPQPTQWADMWNPALAGKITMLDGPSDVLGVSLLMLGHSFNSGDPEQLRAAQQKAVQQKPFVRAYLNAEVRDQLVAGDVWAGQVWSVTAAQAIAAAPNKLNYVLPAEGFPRYADTVAILRESSRQEAAHQFLNYLLRGQVAADIVATTRTSTANARAYALLPESAKQNPVLYPPAAELARGEWFTPQTPAAQRLRDRLWTEIKSA